MKILCYYFLSYSSKERGLKEGALIEITVLNKSQSGWGTLLNEYKDMIPCGHAFNILHFFIRTN